MKLFNRLGIGFTLTVITILGFSEMSRAEHRLIEANGPVMLQRKGWSDFRVTGVGTLVNVGDRLKVETGVKAVIHCSDNTIWRVLTGNAYPVTYGCPNDDLLLRIGQQLDNAPGGQNNAIPYLKCSRRTFVRPDQIKFCWNSVAGASSYTVRLVRQQDQTVIWEKAQVTQTQINYPGNPALVVGEEYLVVIESNNGKSSQLDEGASLSTFEILAPEAIQQINTEIQAISRQELSSEAKTLAVANVYIREELLSEAIQTLEPLAQRNTGIIAVYQNLGDIYRYVGLNLLAESRYQQAIAIATSSQDTEALAMAQAGLAEVKEMLGKRDQAVQLLQQAKTEFESLGDAERVGELDARLQALGAS
ncbi:MAG: tetratricopeptide repeat protein [Crocosphaera sp.]|nr:tetratricopeptide repeat protein [Crocosphaera sp.]